MMASQTAIAMMRDSAVASIKENAAAVSKALGVDPPVLDFFFRDKDYQQAQELKVIGEWLNTVSEKVAPKATKKVKAEV